MGDPVTWFEIHGPDPEQTAKFYSELFGWSMQTMPNMNYTLIDTNAGSGINGGIGQTREGQAPHAVFYAENPDIQSVLDKAESLGATTVVPVTEVPEMVTFAQFTDPFGNLIGLAQGDGSTNVSDGDRAPVDWFELSCAEPEKAWDFYTELFGWTIERDPSEQMVHGQVDAGGGIHGGIGGTPDGSPHVTLYASVDDVQKYLERAEGLGGAVVMPPMQVDERTSIAVFADPQGTAFGVYSTEA
jgi:predicted enzyme related to lactoylglutathione lyase